jgi:hypothetical protein
MDRKRDRLPGWAFSHGFAGLRQERIYAGGPRVFREDMKIYFDETGSVVKRSRR